MLKIKPKNVLNWLYRGKWSLTLMATAKQKSYFYFSIDIKNMGSQKLILRCEQRVAKFTKWVGYYCKTKFLTPIQAYISKGCLGRIWTSSISVFKTNNYEVIKVDKIVSPTPSPLHRHLFLLPVPLPSILNLFDRMKNTIWSPSHLWLTARFVGTLVTLANSCNTWWKAHMATQTSESIT